MFQPRNALAAIDLDISLSKLNTKCREISYSKVDLKNSKKSLRLPLKFLSALDWSERVIGSEASGMARRSGANGRAGRDGGEGVTAALIDALNNPLRRELLRRLHDSDEARSPSELAETVDEGLSNVSYHMRVLAKRRAVKKTRKRQVRGANESFFVSRVAGNERVVLILADTEREDSGARR